MLFTNPTSRLIITGTAFFIPVGMVIGINIAPDLGGIIMLALFMPYLAWYTGASFFQALQERILLDAGEIRDLSRGTRVKLAQISAMVEYQPYRSMYRIYQARAGDQAVFFSSSLRNEDKSVSLIEFIRKEYPEITITRGLLDKHSIPKRGWRIDVGIPLLTFLGTIAALLRL